MSNNFQIQPVGRFVGQSAPVKRPRVCISCLFTSVGRVKGFVIFGIVRIETQDCIASPVVAYQFVNNQVPSRELFTRHEREKDLLIPKSSVDMVMF